MDFIFALAAIASIIGVPVVARRNGKKPILFFVLALLIGPLAFIPLFYSKANRTKPIKATEKVQMPSETTSLSIENSEFSDEYQYVEPEDARVAACPSCGGILKKIPASKTKCPHCGEFMYVRTDPTKNSRVVVTADQAEAIEDEWARINGTWVDRQAQKERFAKTKDELSKQFGVPVSEADVNWRLLNEDSLEHAAMQNWGLYRNTIFQMGEHLRKEAKLKDVLEKYLLVCYIDTCGPNNIGTPVGQVNEYGQKPFTKSEAFLAPGVLAEIAKVALKSQMTIQDMESQFMKMSERYKGAVPFTKNPASSWREIETELKSVF